MRHQFFNPEFIRAWHQAFLKAGGTAEFHLLPPFGEIGHLLFSRGMEIWGPIVHQFLQQRGLLKS